VFGFSVGFGRRVRKTWGCVCELCGCVFGDGEVGGRWARESLGFTDNTQTGRCDRRTHTRDTYTHIHTHATHTHICIGLHIRR
jgi:hypothetical protein